MLDKNFSAMSEVGLCMLFQNNFCCLCAGYDGLRFYDLAEGRGSEISKGQLVVVR